MGEREEGRREGREVGRGRERGKGGEGKEGGGGEKETRVTWPLGERQVPLFLKEKLSIPRVRPGC